MRGLIVKTARFYFKDRSKSTRPEGIKDYQNFDHSAEEFRNVISVWVCIEKDDKEDYLEDLVDRVRELNEKFYHMKHVLVLPFGHLSRNLAPPKKARQFIINLSKLLQKSGFTVDTVTFGTHKDLVFEIPGQPAEVSYFEFPYSGQKPRVS